MDFSSDDCACRNPHTYLPIVEKDQSYLDRTDNYRPLDPSIQSIEKKIEFFKEKLRITAREEFQRRQKFFDGDEPDDYLVNFNYMLENADIRNYLINLVEIICFLKDFQYHHQKCLSSKSLFYIRE
jgi:hypothetical protein